jgi:tetratricopeptide (TPR) repeat protein
MKSLLVLLCCAFSVSAWTQDLNTALKLQNSEQYEEAEKVFQDLIRKDPANGNLYYYYGETVLKFYLADTFSISAEQFANRAEEIFQEGIKQAPGNVLNLVGMGAAILMKTSDTTKANPYFAQAEAAVPLTMKKKEYTPEKAVILTKLAAAQLFGRVNRFQKAINYLNRAKIINPNDPNIYLVLGEVYIRQNDASNALFNYNQALNKDPKSPLPKIRIGNIYMRVPNINAARPYFEEALQIDSTFAPVYRSLGELWTLAGRHDLAKEYYYKFLVLSGNTTPAKIRYGNSLFRAKDYAGALSVIEEVLKVDDSRNYLNRLAAYCCYDKKPQELEKGRLYIETFLKNAEPDQLITRDYLYYGHIMYKLAKNDSVLLDIAFENLKKAYFMDETDKALLSEIASNYYYSRRYTEAIEMFKLKAEKGWAAKGDPMLVGKCYYQLKDLQNADKTFSDIIAGDPDNIQAHVYLARTYSLMETSPDQGLAVPKFEAMIKQIGTRTEDYKQELYEAYKYMGYYNYQVGKFEAAHSWYDKWLNLDPGNKDWQISALLAKAMVDYKRKDYVAARENYRKVLAIDPNHKASKQAVDDLTKVINAERNLR